MNSAGKKPLWPWIVAVLIGLPVLYVASFGPACQMTDRGFIPRAFTITLYRPLRAFLVNCCPDSICHAICDYGMEEFDRGGVPTAVDIIFGSR